MHFQKLEQKYHFLRHNFFGGINPGNHTALCLVPVDIVCFYLLSTQGPLLYVGLQSSDTLQVVCHDFSKLEMPFQSYRFD